MPLYLGGRIAAKIKEAVCKGTVSFLQREARKPGSYFWLKGGPRPAAVGFEWSRARCDRDRHVG